MTLGANDHSLGGDIGVAATTSSSPALTVGNFNGLDVAHTLFSPSVSLGNGAIVGAVDTNSLTNSGGLLGAQAAYPTSMPPLPTLFSATPGSTNVSVAALHTSALSPGNYGALTDNGVVFLNPGTYSFSSVTLGNNAQLVAQPGGSTSVLIAGALQTGTFAQIFPVGQLANALAISVGATDGANLSPPAVSLGASTQIVALLSASQGSLSFGNNVQATGAFAGLNFIAGTNVNLNFQSGFPVQTPTISTFVAYAERSIVLGSNSHSDGGDIGVAATAASSFGTQLTVGSFDDLDEHHTLVAPSVLLGQAAEAGDIEATTLFNSGGTFGAQFPFPSQAMPPLPLAFGGSAGTTDVTVASLRTQTLSPGNYGNLTDNGTVNLSPGAYSFASVTLGNNAQLVALNGGSTTVSVVGALSTGQFAQIFPLLQSASHLSVSVAGGDGPGGSSPIVSIGSNTQLTALLVAPHGTISLGGSVHVTGAIAAFDIATGSQADFDFQDGLPATSSAGLQPVPGYSPPACTLAGSVPQSLTIPLAIGISVTDLPGLESFVHDASDPKSLSYGQVLSVSDFATRFTDPASYGQLVMWAQGANLSTVEFPNNLVLDVSGTAAQIGAALNANLIYCTRPDGSFFYEPDRVPALALATPILGVDGLDNAVLPQPEGGSAPGGGSKGAYQSQDLRTAYASCQPNLTGAGQTIGIFSFGGFSSNNIQQYINTTNLASANPAVALPVLAPLLDNATNSPDTETEGDIEMALAMAPGAQVVVFVGQLNDSILTAMASFGATPLGMSLPPMSQLTSSWNKSLTPMTAQLVLELAAARQSLFQSSGDSGAYEPTSSNCTTAGTEGPPNVVNVNLRSLPGVTTVGGTVLTMNGAGVSWASETGWPGSGGGVMPSKDGSPNIPDYQANVNTGNAQVSTTFANLPDVSMPAANLYSFRNGSANASGGTSSSAPLWAGFMALANEQRQLQPTPLPAVGFANPLLYAIATFPGYSTQFFNDIQDGGQNTNTCGLGDSAVTGYDLVTGLGSPQCGLIQELTAVGEKQPQVTITLSDFSICTTGGNLFNCGGGTGSCNQTSLNDVTITCNPSRSADGSISATMVTVPAQEYVCGHDGHGGVVQVDCYGSGQPGQIGINGDVTFSISDNCGTNQIQSNNALTFSFTDLLPGTPQQPAFGNPFQHPSSSPLVLEACSNPGNACNGLQYNQLCQFNNFQAVVTVTNTGGF